METDFNEFNESMIEQYINEFTVKTKSNYITLDLCLTKNNSSQ